MLGLITFSVALGKAANSLPLNKAGRPGGEILFEIMQASQDMVMACIIVIVSLTPYGICSLIMGAIAGSTAKVDLTVTAQLKASLMHAAQSHLQKRVDALAAQARCDRAVDLHMIAHCDVWPQALLLFMFCAMMAMACHICLTLVGFLVGLGKVPPLGYYQNLKPAAAMAFGTPLLHSPCPLPHHYLTCACMQRHPIESCVGQFARPACVTASACGGRHGLLRRHPPGHYEMCRGQRGVRACAKFCVPARSHGQHGWLL